MRGGYVNARDPAFKSFLRRFFSKKRLLPRLPHVIPILLIAA
jgi:hypothetical protein